MNFDDRSWPMESPVRVNRRKSTDSRQVSSILDVSSSQVRLENSALGRIGQPSVSRRSGIETVLTAYAQPLL